MELHGSSNEIQMKKKEHQLSDSVLNMCMVKDNISAELNSPVCESQRDFTSGAPADRRASAFLSLFVSGL